MKKFLLFIACLFMSNVAFAVYPENEAEFLYNHKNNSTIKYDYINQRNYIKTSNYMYIRNDGATIHKNTNGIVETSTGKSYMPVGSGNNKIYVPMDL